jgi:hypothetical protein
MPQLDLLTTIASCINHSSSTMSDERESGSNYYNSQDDGPVNADSSYGDKNSENALSGSAAIRPVFLGNLNPTYHADDIMAIFHRPIVPPGTAPGKFKPIPVDRLDQKRGYCFVFLKDAIVQEDKDNAEQFVEAISGM